MKNNEFDELLNEAMDAGGTLFGGAGGGGSGTFSYTQQAGAKTWSPRSPRGRMSTSDPQGYNVKDIADDEHIFKHQAPKKRPFPLETINDFYADAFLQLANAEIQLKTCDKHNALLASTPEKKALIKHLYEKTKAIKIMIKKLAEDLDRVTYS